MSASQDFTSYGKKHSGSVPKNGAVKCFLVLEVTARYLPDRNLFNQFIYVNLEFLFFYF